MRTIPADLQTHLNGHSTTLALCCKIKRADDTTYGFTTVDKTLSIDLSDGDGSIDYKPATLSELSALRRSATLAPDNMDAGLLLDSPDIEPGDLRAQLFDGAEATVFLVNWADLTDGTVVLHHGSIGQVRLGDRVANAELLPLSAAFNMTIGEVVTAECRADLGDARCKVRLDPPDWEAETAYTVREDRDAGTGSVVSPTTENGCQFKCTTAGTSDTTEPTWDTTVGNTTEDGTVVWTAILALSQTGTVSVVTSNRAITATGISLGAGHWTGGLITWLTGDNAGAKHEVKSDDGSGVLTLFLPTGFDIAVGDTFTITAGCDKIHDSDCKTRFDNILNFRGEPHVPGSNVQFSYPDAR